jgi:hypothetical protein
MRNDTNLLMLSGEITSPITITPGTSKKLEFTLTSFMGQDISLFPVALTGTYADQFFAANGSLKLTQGDKMLLVARVGNDDNGNLAIAKIQSAEKVTGQAGLTEPVTATQDWNHIPSV